MSITVMMSNILNSVNVKHGIPHICIGGINVAMELSYSKPYEIISKGIEHKKIINILVTLFPRNMVEKMVNSNTELFDKGIWMHIDTSDDVTNTTILYKESELSSIHVIESNNRIMLIPKHVIDIFSGYMEYLEEELLIDIRPYHGQKFNYTESFNDITINV